MIETPLPSIYLTFTPRNEDTIRLSGATDQRLRFWSATLDVLQFSNQDRVLEQSEAGLGRFGDRLADQIEQQIIYLLQHAHNLKHEQARDILRHADEPIRFQLRGYEYGSLTLELSVEGIPTLADAFAGNLDLLFHVLERYSPEALFGCVPYDRRVGADLNAKVTVTKPFELEFLRQARSAYKPSARQIPEPTESPTTQLPIQGPIQQSFQPWHLSPKANTTWIAANFVLLIPVLLSFAAQYLIYRSLSDERAAIAAQAQSLQKRESEVLSRLSEIAFSNRRDPKDGRIDSTK